MADKIRIGILGLSHDHVWDNLVFLARSELGEIEEGLAENREGLAIFYRSGALVPLVYRACYLAEVLGRAGRPADGIEAIDGALERSRGRLDRFFDAEVSGNGGDAFLTTPGGGRTSVRIPSNVVLNLKALGKDKRAYTGYAFYSGSKALHRYDSKMGKMTTVTRVQDDAR